MDLSISDEYRACDPVTRDICHQALKRAVEIGAIGAGITFNHSKLQRGVCFKFGFQRGKSGLGGASAVSELHAF